MQQLWLVTVPNRGESPEATYTSLQRLIPTSKIHRFEIPGLVVGTLDSLMALSDDLTKINTQVEVINSSSLLCSVSHLPLRLW
jgi:V-type H+-transporting ATPase subunit C